MRVVKYGNVPSKVAGVVVGGVLSLAGCGSQRASDASEGWHTLTTDQVTVAYPKAWKAVPKQKLGKATDGIAVLEKDGREIAKVSVELDFMSRGDAELAAGAAQSSIEFNGRVGKQQKVDVPGTDDAQRTDFTQTGDGSPGKAPKGAKINGIDIVGIDTHDHAFLVRITGTEDGASKAELEKIAKSVEVKSAK